jgi:hypothetical protein
MLCFSKDYEMKKEEEEKAENIIHHLVSEFKSWKIRKCVRELARRLTYLFSLNSFTFNFKDQKFNLLFCSTLLPFHRLKESGV